MTDDERNAYLRERYFGKGNCGCECHGAGYVTLRTEHYDDLIAALAKLMRLVPYVSVRKGEV